MCNCDKSLQVNASNVPNNEGVDDVDHEPVHLAHGGARHRSSHQDGWWREEEEEKSEEAVAKTKVDEEQATGLPGLEQTDRVDNILHGYLALAGLVEKDIEMKKLLQNR